MLNNRVTVYGTNQSRYSPLKRYDFYSQPYEIVFQSDVEITIKVKMTSAKSMNMTIQAGQITNKNMESSTLNKYTFEQIDTWILIDKKWRLKEESIIPIAK